MWLVELMMVSLIGGSVLGIGWYLIDNWREKMQEENIANTEKANNP